MLFSTPLVIGGGSGGGGSSSIGGTVTGGTAGSVLFINPSAVLAQDNANFFYDDSNNRLGLGTATPSVTLHTDSNSANTVAIQRLENTGGFFDTFRVDATPEGSVTAPVGAMANDTTTGKLYYKATGAGNTGWTEIDKNTTDDWTLNGNIVTAQKTLGTLDGFALPIITASATRFTVSASAATLTSTGNGTINTDTGSSITIDSLDTGAVNIGNGTTAKTITVGNVTGATAVAINSGSGAIIANVANTPDVVFKVQSTGANRLRVTKSGALVVGQNSATDATLETDGCSLFMSPSSASSQSTICIDNSAGSHIGFWGAAISATAILNDSLAGDLCIRSVQAQSGSGRLRYGNDQTNSTTLLLTNSGANNLIMTGGSTTPGTFTINTNTSGNLVIDSGTTGEVQIAGGANAKVVKIADNTLGNTVYLNNGANTVANVTNIGAGNGSANNTINIGSGTPTAGITTVNVGNATAGIATSVNIKGAVTYSVTTVSTTQTLADNISYVRASGTITLTLPTGTLGQFIRIKNTGTGTVTVASSLDTGTSFPFATFALGSASSQDFVSNGDGTWWIS